MRLHVEDEGRKLTPGMTGFARVICHRQRALAVPREAVTTLSAGKGMVRTVDASGGHTGILVSLGQVDERFVEITGGLDASDWVLTRNPRFLRDDDKLDVTRLAASGPVVIFRPGTGAPPNSCLLYCLKLTVSPPPPCCWPASCCPGLPCQSGYARHGSGGYAAILREAPSTLAFKIFVVCVLLSAGWIGYRRRRSGSLAWAMPMVTGGSLLLVAVTIAYPAMTIQRCAEVSAHAAWLQTQNVSLIRVGGDVRTAQEYSHQPGEWEVGVKDILPRAFVAIPTPVSSFFELRVARLPQLAMWLGFSPAFYEFAGPGWFCGIFGSFLLVVSLARRKNGEGGPGPVGRLARRVFHGSSR